MISPKIHPMAWSKEIRYRKNSGLKVWRRMENTSLAKVEILLRASDVASRLNISRSLAYRLIQSGEIPVIRINHAVRVRMVNLENFIQTLQSGWKDQI
jgi:excisionase family DNA binding protein